MKFTRRNFLAWAGLSAVGAVGCDIFGSEGQELRIQSPARQAGGPGQGAGQLVRHPLPPVPFLRRHPRPGDGRTRQEGAGQPDVPGQPGTPERPLRRRSPGPVPPRPHSGPHAPHRAARLRPLHHHDLGRRAGLAGRRAQRQGRRPAAADRAPRSPPGDDRLPLRRRLQRDSPGVRLPGTGRVPPGGPERIRPGPPPRPGHRQRQLPPQFRRRFSFDVGVPHSLVGRIRRVPPGSAPNRSKPWAGALTFMSIPAIP